MFLWNHFLIDLYKSHACTVKTIYVKLFEKNIICCLNLHFVPNIQDFSVKVLQQLNNIISTIGYHTTDNNIVTSTHHFSHEC